MFLFLGRVFHTNLTESLDSYYLICIYYYQTHVKKSRNKLDSKNHNDNLFIYIYIWRITVLGETCSVTILCWQNGNQVNRTAVIAEFLTLWIEGRLQNEYICPMGLFFRGYRAGIFSSASAGYTQEGIFSSSKVFIFPLRIRYLSRNFVHLQRYSPSNSVIWILLFEHQPRPRGTSPWAH